MADLTSQFDAIWGSPTPITPPQPANNARAQEIMNMGNGNQQDQSENPDNPDTGVTKNPNGTYNTPTLGNALFNTALGVGKQGINDIRAIGSWLASSQGSDPSKPTNAWWGSQPAFNESPFAKAFPQQTMNNQAQQGGALATKAGEVLIPAAGLVSEGIARIPALASEIKNNGLGIGEAVNWVTGAGGKTAEEIANTAPENVSKLSLRDQEIWKNNALNASKTQEQAALTAEQAKTKGNITQLQTEGGINRTALAQDTQTKAEALTKKLADAENGYTGASINDINNMKKEGQGLLSQKNEEFATQRNKELTGFRRVRVTNQQIADVIKAEETIPGDAAKVKEILGINNTNLIDKTNIANIEQLSKDMRGMTPKSQRTGASVFSVDSVFYNKAADVLDKVMENNGVDLSGSKSIWREWAPTRDSLVKDFNVFDNQNFEKDSAANMLKSRTEGVPGNYQNKLASVEKALGRPLDQETSAAFKNLNDVQREKATAEINARLAQDASTNAQRDAIEQEKLDSQFRQGNISAAQESSERAINQKAIDDRRAKIINNVIKGAAVAGVAAGANYVTGNKVGSAIGGTVRTLTGI